MSEIIASDVIQAQMELSIRNPKATTRIMLDLLERMTNGEVVVVDASNPFVYALEMAAVTTSGGLIQAEALGRRLYPSMARTQEEAYLHMGDADYIGRFATPSETVLGFVMPLEDILGKAVPINDGSGARALVLPRHTSMTYGNYTFTLQYPIVIKVLFNNTLNIMMDLTNKAPTWVPSTNVLTWSTSILDTAKWIMIEAPVQQVKIASHVLQVTAHTGFSNSYSFEDEFYHARAYIKDAYDRWVEIKTTHQEQVYDPSKPTVCLKVLNRSLSVYIPQIYFQNGLINGSIRIDIYTTKGKLDIDLTTGDASTPRIKYQDLDNALTEYSTPFTKFTNITAFARKRITGGSAPLTFAELITRLRSRSAYTEGLPITNTQLGSLMRSKGFELSTSLYNITSRQYTASREIDPPENKTTVTGLGCSIQLVQFTLEDLKVNPIIFESNKRATIKPTELFIHDSDGLKILDEDYVTELKQMAAISPDSIANVVNGMQYHFTPFHYVFDMGLNTFGVRPYFMTSPTVETRYIYQQNAGLGLNIRSAAYAVEYLADGSGYRVILSLEQTASLAALTAEMLSLQLSYIVPDSTSRAWLKGELISPIDVSTGKPINDQWLFAFDIKTEFDIDTQHHMSVTETGFPMGLTQELDIIYVIKDYMPPEASYSDIDAITSRNHINNYQYTSTYIACTQEKMTVKFGQYLDHLWRRSRTVVAEEEYRTYPEDIMDYWTKDVYEVDGTGTPIIDYNPSTGEVSLNKLHSLGDPVLDPNGNHRIKYHKGATIYDEDGRPVPLKSEMELAREVDMFFVDGRYFFATEESTLTYLDTSLNQVAEWIDGEIRDANRRCLERTDILFFPKMSSGLIDVVVGDGEMVRLKAAQSLKVKYVLRKEKYKNLEIRDNLTEKTPEMLLAAFKSLPKTNGGILTAGDIKAFIKALVKDDVVDVRLSGFLEDRYEAALTNDVSAMPTIGKKLVTLSNLTLQVQDDVSVDFEVLDTDVLMPYTVNTI